MKKFTFNYEDANNVLKDIYENGVIKNKKITIEKVDNVINRILNKYYNITENNSLCNDPYIVNLSDISIKCKCFTIGCEKTLKEIVYLSVVFYDYNKKEALDINSEIEIKDIYFSSPFGKIE